MGNSRSSYNLPSRSLVDRMKSSKVKSKSQLCCQVNVHTRCKRCGGPICKNHARMWASYANCSNCFDIGRAKSHIQRALDQDGPYTHNICSINLRLIETFKGRKEANKVIDEFDLTELYNISKEIEE